nr:cell division protein 48 [Seculamonas ecuadoriensis]
MTEFVYRGCRSGDELSAKCRMHFKAMRVLGVRPSSCVVLASVQDPSQRWLCTAWPMQVDAQEQTQFFADLSVRISTHGPVQEGVDDANSYMFGAAFTIAPVPGAARVAPALFVTVPEKISGDVSQALLVEKLQSVLKRLTLTTSVCVNLPANSLKSLSKSISIMVSATSQSTNVDAIDAASFPLLFVAGSTRFSFLRSVGDAPSTNATDAGASASVSSSDSAVSVESESQQHVEVLGGLDHVLREMRELVRLPLEAPHVFLRLRVQPPKGVLLSGPPGVGKTSLVRVIARECNALVVSVDCGSIADSTLGESERKLREAFETARSLFRRHARPVILFLDEIESLCAKREDYSSHLNARLVAQLLTLMDSVTTYVDEHAADTANPTPLMHVLVVAATNAPNQLDPALRRPGRFDREVVIDAPDEAARLDILRARTAQLTLADDVDLAALARRCVGYVGADLTQLCSVAYVSAMFDTVRLRDTPDAHAVTVRQSHFETAFARIRPSLHRDPAVLARHGGASGGVAFDDIGGLEDVKKLLLQSIEWPLRYADTFARFALRPPRGILLHGPPGCAKTTLAKAVASSCALTFVFASGASIYSPFVGESERQVRELFRKARLAAPAVIFFDEIDVLVGKRDASSDDSGGGSSVRERILATLLNEMDGAQAVNDVLVMGATNRADKIDAALLRPGRFDRILFIGPPDEPARLGILRVHTRRVPLDEGVDLEALAKKTDLWTGAELEQLCREAALSALRRSVDAASVTNADFECAFQSLQPQLTPERVDEFRAMLATSSNG